MKKEIIIDWDWFAHLCKLQQILQTDIAKGSINPQKIKKLLKHIDQVEWRISSVKHTDNGAFIC